MNEGSIRLDSLRIGSQELDEITGLDISYMTMGWAYRQRAFEPEHRWALLIDQVLSGCMALVLCIPIMVTLVRAASGDDVQAVWRSLPIGFLGAIALTLVWNLFRWQAGKRLITLSHLLDEIDRFNEMVVAVEILEELGSTTQPLTLENRHDVIEALHLTRENLVYGLSTERIMRRHQRFMARRQEMFSSIERNLVTLHLLDVSNEASEYGQLLNEAIMIGISVREELAKDSL